MVLFIWGPFSTVISKTVSFPNQLPTELIGKNCHSVNRCLNFYWYTLDATSLLLLSQSAIFVSILHCTTWIQLRDFHVNIFQQCLVVFNVQVINNFIKISLSLWGCSY